MPPVIGVNFNVLTYAETKIERASNSNITNNS